MSTKKPGKQCAVNFWNSKKNGGDDFLARTVKRDETWLDHFEPEAKRQPMEWHHANSPKKKKFKTVSSAEKLWLLYFFDSEGLLLVHIMPHAITLKKF